MPFGWFGARRTDSRRARAKGRCVYLLMSYRHEVFIAEAVHSALAQDFEPLEIVISDDCSPDGTFDLIEEIVAGYAGPHELRINRNVTRMGSVDHLAAMADLIGDAFIVMAHGDDVAEPRRARTLFDAWLRENVSMVSSGTTWIDSDLERHNVGYASHRVSADEILDWVPEMLGATLAFHSEIISGFERLSSEALSAGLDSVLPLRAEAMNGMYFVGEKLVQYRRHDRNMGTLTADRTRSQEIFQEGNAAHVLAIRNAQLADLRYLTTRGGTVSRRHKDLLAALERRIEEELAAWVRKRAALRRQQLVSTWCHESEMIARRQLIEVMP